MATEADDERRWREALEKLGEDLVRQKLASLGTEEEPQGNG
jgi:hypothetical protein